DGPLRIDADAVVLRDLAANHAAAIALRATRDVGRVRLSFAERIDHTFIPGRDSVDIYTSFGASVRVSGNVRLGVEYVAQELEDLFDDDTDGGLRQLVAADTQLTLRGGWLLSLGPTWDSRASVGAHAAIGRPF